MNLNVGVNNKKKLKELRKTTKFPKSSYSNYYSYKYNVNPSHNNSYENSDLNDTELENHESYINQMIHGNKYKTLALAGAGISLGIIGVCLLKKCIN